MWTPTKYKCNNCGDIVWSHWSGHFNVCKCWKDSDGKTGFFVDETKHYTRFGGNTGFVPVGDDGNEIPEEDAG